MHIGTWTYWNTRERDKMLDITVWIPQKVPKKFNAM